MPQDKEADISVGTELGAGRLVLCEQMMRAVMAAMSGGIDSAVAAARLVRQGWSVVGVTMGLGPPLLIYPWRLTSRPLHRATRPYCIAAIYCWAAELSSGSRV